MLSRAFPGFPASMPEVTVMSAVQSVGAAAAASVALDLPPAISFDPDELHARLGLVGGNMARAWLSFVHGGTTYVADFAHEGSSADPTDHVASLSSATRIAVSLSTGHRTGTQVAAAAAAAINTATSSSDASNSGARLTIANGSSLTIPADVDTTDPTLAGMIGVLREVYETSVGITQANSDGGTDSTTAQHCRALSGRTDFPAARAMRIIGVYCAGHTGYRPRCGIYGLGTADSTSPGTLTRYAEGRMASGLVNGEIGVCPLADPPAGMDTDDAFWIVLRGDTATSPGGTRFRTHNRTLEFDGDLSTGNGTTTGMLLVDNTADDAATTEIGASYAVTVDSSFGIYLTQGAVFEMADASGNYPANGRILKRIGSHLAENAGTQFIADADQLDTEVTSHRFLPPLWPTMPVTAIAREYDTITGSIDCRAAVYQFDDLDYPSTTPAVLLADFGATGPSGSEITRTAVSLDIGTDNADRVSGDYVALTWNYVPSTMSGTDMEMPVYLDEAAGDDSWIDMWTGSSRNDYRGHTSIPGYSGRIRGGGFRAPSSDANEYRSTNIAGMPHDTISETYPDPWVTDATDDTPSADANEYMEITVAGMVAA